MLNDVCNFGLPYPHLQVQYAWEPCPHRCCCQQSSLWIGRQWFILWTHSQLQPRGGSPITISASANASTPHGKSSSTTAACPSDSPAPLP